MDLLEQLKSNYRYSDYYLPDDRYERYLRQLYTEPLTQELVDYLCSQIDNPKNKRSCELRFIHLQPLFINSSAQNFNLKEYLYSHIVKCRRLWLKIFYQNLRHFCNRKGIRADYTEIRNQSPKGS